MENLLDAARMNDLERIHELLVEQKALSNVSEDKDRAQIYSQSLQKALHISARNNHVAAVELLLGQDCDIDTSTIVSAVAGESKDVIELLIAKGWDINLSLGHVGDALILAVGADKLELVRYLLAHGADPNMNLRGELRTPLECATYSGSKPVIEALLDAGASIKGRSALPIAAGQGRTEIVSYLLDRGADIDEIPDNDEIYENERELGVKNALCEAAAQGQTAVVRLLLERGADASNRDTSGKSASELAKLGGHDDCKRLLEGEL